MSTATPTAAAVLGRLGSRIRFGELPEPVRERVIDIFVDTVAVLAGGGCEPPLRQLAESGWLGHGTDGQATVLATGDTASAVGAAIANGSCGNAQLLGEGVRVPGGHPAIQVVPAVLAAAEQVGATGHDLLGAVLVGYEVAVRVGRALGRMQDGLHPNGNWGSIGAAAGVAYLVGGADETTMAAAIDGAAGLAVLGPMAFGHQGVDVYHLLAGLGVGMAVSVGAMAGQGWTADPGTLENFFAPRASAHGEVVDWAPFLAEPVHYSVLENYFKRYPACAHTMSSIDAAAKLAEERRPSVREIEFIEIRCGVEAAAELNSVDPPNLFGGRYSIPFLSAVALVRGRSDVIALDVASLYDDEVRRLSSATVVKHDPALAREYGGGRPAAIKVTLRDGTSLESVVPTPTGESANPMARADLDQKALALLGSRYGDTAGSVLHELRDGVAADRPVAELSQLLRQPV